MKREEEIELTSEIQKRMLWWLYFNPTNKVLYWIRRIVGPLCVGVAIYLMAMGNGAFNWYYAVFCFLFGMYYIVRPFLILLFNNKLESRKIQLSLVDRELSMQQESGGSTIDLANWQIRVHKSFLELRQGRTPLLIPRSEISKEFEDALLAVYNL